MAFEKGKSGNPKGRPKSAALETVETLNSKRRMIEKGLSMLDDEWEAIVKALVRQAKSGNVQAFTALRDSFLGKPKEQQEITTPDGGKFVFNITKD